MNEKHPSELTLDEIEEIEKLTLRWIFQAVTDFIACIPNGFLQDRYNPTYDDNIWLAGRNAPTLGEDFRVRLSFTKLKAKSSWRVQRISYNESSMECAGRWES